MTIATTTSRMPPYVGNNTAHTFAYDFKVFDADDLRVLVLDDDDVVTVLTRTTHYTVTGVGEAAGGNVVLVDGAFAWIDDDGDLDDGYSLIVRRVAPLLQETAGRNNSRYSGGDAELDLDKASTIDQQQQEQIERSLRLPEEDAGTELKTVLPTLAERKGKLLGFNETTGKPQMFARNEGGGGDGSGTLVLAGDGIDVVFDEDENSYTVSLFSAFVAALSGGSTNEVGASVASISLTWSYNKAITGQTLTGTGATTPLLADRAQTVTGPFTTDTTFTVEGDTGDETDDATTSITFLRKRHWGVSSDTSLSSAEILSLLSGSELSSSRAQSRSLSPSAQYIHFAWPSTFGTPVFTVNGLTNTAWTKTTVSHTNASGSTTNYDVYRSDNLLTGDYTIVVT